MNEKKQRIKSLVSDLDSMRIDLLATSKLPCSECDNLPADTCETCGRLLDINFFLARKVKMMTRSLSREE